MADASVSRRARTHSVLSGLLWGSAGVTGILALGLILRLPHENAKLLFPALMLSSLLAAVLARYLKRGGTLTKPFAALAAVRILPLLAFVSENIFYMFTR